MVDHPKAVAVVEVSSIPTLLPTKKIATLIIKESKNEIAKDFAPEVHRARLSISHILPCHRR